MAAPTSLLAPGVGTLTGKADPATQLHADLAGKQASNHALFTDTVAKVRGGELSPDEGGKRLTAAGFPARDNPFVQNPTGGVGGVVHDIAAPVGLSRSANLAAENKYMAAHGGRPPINAGTVTPGTGVVAQVLGGAAQKAIYSPAGVYDAVTHPVPTAQHVAAQVEHVVSHPLSDPAATLFDSLAALGVAGGVAGRIAGATSALRKGEGVAAAVARPTHEGGSLLHAPPPAPRVYQVGDEQVHMLPSRSLPMRGAQELYDRAARKAIAENPQGRLAGHATTRIGKTLEAQRRTDAALREVPAAELQKAAKPLASPRLTPQTRRENMMAVRLTAKNVSPEEQLAFHKRQFAEAQAAGNKAAMARHAKQAVTVQGVIDRGLVTTDAAGNVAAAGKAAKAEALHHEISQKTEAILADSGLMTPAGIAARRDAPGRIVAGGEYVDNPANPAAKEAAALEQQGQTTLAPRTPEETVGKGIVGGETARPGRSFVSDKAVKNRPSRSPFGRARGPVVGTQRNPLSPQHPYTGAGEKAGVVPDNPLRSAAEHYRELVRYANTNEFRQAAARMGSDTKQTSRDVLVSDQTSRQPKIPDDTRVALGQKELTTEEFAGHTAGFEDWLRGLILGRADHFAADEAAHIGHPAPAGYKWVDRNVLGDLGKPQGHLEDLVGEKAARLNDRINNGEKAAIVYLKPGHFATRYVTNATLAILHGAANPVGITRSIRTFMEQTPRQRLEMMALGGQGYVHAIFDPVEGEGHLSGMIGKVAGGGAKFWGHQDTPFRYNAVAYEFRKAGFTTTARINAALANPDRYRAQLHEVAMRANKENIEYDRLGPREKQVVARVLWFYPWVKGSTLYAGRFVAEHPIKAGVVANLGQEGAATQQKQLGAVPSYEEGLMKVGGTKAFPTTVNPRSLSLFSTPGEVTNIGLGLLGGKFGTSAAEAGSMFTPSISAAKAIAYKQDPFGNAEPHATVWHILGQQLFDSTPAVLAYSRLRDLGYLRGLGVKPSQTKIQAALQKAVAAKLITPGQARQLAQVAKQAGTKKMFPVTAREALGMFFAGSWFPRETNQSTLHAQALKEMTPADRLHAELETAVKAHLLTPAEAKQFAKAGP